jgi:glutaredoxin
MLDRVRETLYRAITTPKGDSLLPIRLPKDLARRLNATFGSPLAPVAELAKRKAAKERLASLRGGKGNGANGVTAANGANGTHAAPAAKPEAAPVMVYFEKDRNARELGRIEEALGAKSIAYKLLDVTGDEPALDFVMREAHCEKDELPIVFVGGAAIGGFRQLVEADVSGKLEQALYGG